jgi:sugar O-acyltransferase (sialic acid O-acetyltransferase NeuD family)
VTNRFVVGAGGHGRVVLEVWRAAEPGCVFKFADDDVKLHGSHIMDAEVAGPASIVQDADGLAVLAIGNNPLRLALAERLGPGTRWGRVIHPSATVMPSAEIGPGSVAFAGAVINTAAVLGAHVIVNTGVVVEHDCVLEDGVTVSPGACMGGRVHLGRGCFISVGATLAPRVRVGAGTIVGAGAVVVGDLPAGVLAYGVPARPMRSLDDGFDWRRVL